MSGCVRGIAGWRGTTLCTCLIVAAMLVVVADPVLLADPGRSQTSSDAARSLVASGRQAFSATRYDDALANFETAAEQFAAAGDAVGEAAVRLEIGLVLLEAGAMRRGRAIIEQAVSSLPPNIDTALQGRALIRLAQGMRATRDVEDAETTLERAESLYQATEDADGLSQVWAERSALAGLGERWQHAVDFASRAVTLATDPTFRLGAMANESYALHQLGELEAAREAYRRVLKESKAQHDLRFVNFAYCNIADVSWKLGEKKPALEDLWRALEGIERARSQIAGTPEERTAYLARQVAVYDRLIRFLVDTSDSRSAFNVAERFRARSFLEMLRADDRAPSGAAPGVPTSKVTASLATQQRAVVQALGAARLALQEQATADGRAAIRGELEALEIELDRLRAAQRGEGRGEAVDTRSRGAIGDISDLQAALEPDEVVLAYWVSEARTLVWAIGAENRILFQVPLSQDELGAAVRDYLEPLRFPRRAEDLAIRGQEGQHIARGRELYRWLIEPMPDWAKAARRLVVIPDAELHYLPFEALIRTCDAGAVTEADAEIVHGVYRGCTFLGLEKALAYSPSAGTFLAIRKRARNRQPVATGDSLLAVAPSFEAPAARAREVLPAEMRGTHLRGIAPLDHTRDEVERIAAHVPSTLSLLGADASEQRFKSEAGRFRFLHLATHGLVDDSLPMSSGVLLDAGGGEDGLLQANEILRLRLAAELVTLSACRSGRGRLQRGQGIVGLSRAFLFAGASSVAVSLWDVDDRSTPLLMETFYRQAAAGNGYDEALRAARVALFAEETETRLVHRTRRMSYAHPRFWAGFVLIGTP